MNKKYTVPKGCITGSYNILTSATQLHKSWEAIDRHLEESRKRMVHSNYKHWRWNKYFSYYLAGLGLMIYTTKILKWHLSLDDNIIWTQIFDIIFSMGYISWGCLLYRYSVRKIKELFIDTI